MRNLTGEAEIYPKKSKLDELYIHGILGIPIKSNEHPPRDVAEGTSTKSPEAMPETEVQIMNKL